MAFLGGSMQRRHLVEIRRIVHCRALGDEQFYNIHVSAICRRMQRRQSMFVSDFDVGAALQQQCHDTGASGQGCDDKSRIAGFIEFSDDYALVKQLPDAIDITLTRRIVQRAGQGGRRDDNQPDHSAKKRFHGKSSTPDACREQERFMESYHARSN
ncbi:hypothetical protein MesoLjLb_45770 [Mesorhizobium sp. L-8-3]|nr:hypothetical protein MesoLjLb_45770 [Mesorhizobium sp. L-8-3]